MARPRLLFFLCDIEGNLTALRQTLRHVCEEAGLSAPDVAWAEGPPAFAEAGWRIVEVLPGPEGTPECGLEAHLQLATEALARDFRERAVVLLVHPDERYARASQSQPGRAARNLEGEFPDVLRQAAHWLTLDTLALARLVGEPRRTVNVLAAHADFGDGPQPPPDARPTPVPAAPAEPDEDDRFVEAKLAQARALMAQYLGSARR